MDWQPAYNICKLIFQLLRCYNSRPYKPLSWTSSTLKFRQYTDYMLRTHLIFISTKVRPFDQVLCLFFFCIHSRQEPIATTTHAKNVKFSKFSILEQPENIDLPEETFQCSIGRVSIIFDKMCLDFTKIHSDNIM